MDALAPLAERVRALEDLEAIKSLKYQYLAACDAKRPDLVRECFAPGPVHIDFGRIGVFRDREALVEVFTRLACHEHIVEMHHAQNPRIRLLDGEKAQGEWGLYYFLINSRDRQLTQFGARYEDEYRKVAGVWKICASTCIIYSTLLLQLEEALPRILFAGRTSPEELDDPGGQA